MDSEMKKTVNAALTCEVRGMRVMNRSGRELVRGLDLRLAPGESLGLVGESGSGKTLTCKALLGLLPEGLSALFEKKEITEDTAMVFQNPMSALDPLCRVRRQLEEILETRRGLSGTEAVRRAKELFVRLALPEELLEKDRYPWELSGGQCQRVLIAMALACRPELLVCDEPTTALDVAVQEQTLSLIGELQRELGFAMIFVTHNLAVASRMCGRLAVMREGRIIEQGSREDILERPREAYTRELIEAVPELPDPEGVTDGTVAAP